MTPTDVKALKPGQRVLVEAKVVSQAIGNGLVVRLPGGSGGQAGEVVPPEAIHSVLPDPIKAGDRVKDSGGIEGVVLDLCDEVACVRFFMPVCGARFGERLLSSLERI